MVTGLESRAKALAKISLVLVGEDSKREPIVMGRLALREGHFWPGYMEQFKVQVPETMTQFTKVIVSYDNVVPHFGWFMQQVSTVVYIPSNL